ncbi:hypothetical protein BV898_03021 [Hypsibius exemplaris]|uniref:Receptor ligand binding region domain-containing protein n=1 Tax=Hypsibius exemplaris TaxID=2072580 RepID=A0A1W0X6G9_HYPEX|nr:hypothetical protein BV898_03021 [Hypsibius exemplaris]
MDRIRDVDKYPTWIATNFYPNPSALYCTFLRSLNWTRIYVVIEGERFGDYYYYLSKFVLLQFKNCGLQSWQYTCRGPNDTCSPSEVDTMLLDFHSKTRIMVLFGRPQVMRDILIQASRLNMTAGDHVYVGNVLYGNTRKATDGFFAWHWRGTSNSSMHILQKAFQSVLLLHMVNVKHFMSPNIQKYVPDWERLAKHKYGNINLTHELGLPDLTSTQVAMELVGKIISEANASNIHSFSGSTLARKILNRQYNLTVGSTFVTPQGQMQYKTYASYYDTETSEFTVIINYNRIYCK